MSYGNTPHSDQIYTITAHLADLDLYLQALSQVANGGHVELLLRGRESAGR